MSTTSIKPVPTLKGIFSVPKMNHRRDFLRENKLNLRELQRVTTNKNKASQQQEQQKQSKQQQMYQQQQQQLDAIRRSDSQQRIQPHKLLTRSISQQRPSVEVAKQTRQPSRCSSACSVNNGRGDAVRRSSNMTVSSKAESCDKQIQTEDINDEEFLYQALKRCTASEFNGHSSAKKHLNDIHHRQTHSDPNMPHHSSCVSDQEDYHNELFQSQQQYQKQHQQQQYLNQQQHHLQQHQHNQQQDQTQPDSDHEAKQDTQRTRNSFHLNNNNDNEIYNNSARIPTTRSQHSHMNGHQQTKPEADDIHLHLDNLAIDDNQCDQRQQQSVQQPPLSGRSRLTIGSTRSQELPLIKKKSNGSLHKCGSRDDVRLPRYLEREKREKEEQRMREMVRDPNCPLGHFALTDDERLAALATAQKKFQSLIDELNHMPMTTQTLRIRTRKAVIEKELAILEADIRIFSKSKVYIKKPDEAEN